MTKVTDQQVLAVALPILKHDEGCRLTAYKDTQGLWTVGWGHAYVPEGTCWTQEQADAQLDADVRRKIEGLDEIGPWWRDLDPVRASVVLMMAFNLGLGGFFGFRTTIERIRAGDYAGASASMLLSKWASQVGDRAQRLAFMMRTGSVPVMK